MRRLITLLLLAGITLTSQAQTDCGLPHDINNNGSVDIEDFLSILGLFGDQDSDGDGLYDSQDNCFDLTSCNYMDTEAESCLFLDAVGECGGFCTSDLDGDGVCDPCSTPVSYQGYDYATVLIGDQCWFAENLRSENYENGDAIPEVSDNGAWSGLISGARCDYDNDASNAATYGRLYNWCAVDDARGLCPSGWHVPTDGEWMTMEMTLGMSEAEANDISWRGTNQGTQLKTIYGWYNNGNGTNSSGFSGLPGSRREYTGSFDSAEINGVWWTSSSSTGESCFNGESWGRYLGFAFESISRDDFNKNDGFSVRCIQDSEE